MSFWEQLKQNVSQINNSLQTNISKFKNNDFAEASMAICALIASADGSINPAERQKTTALIVSNETPGNFKSSSDRCNSLALTQGATAI